MADGHFPSWRSWKWDYPPCSEQSYPLANINPIHPDPRNAPTGTIYQPIVRSLSCDISFNIVHSSTYQTYPPARLRHEESVTLPRLSKQGWASMILWVSLMLSMFAPRAIIKTKFLTLARFGSCGTWFYQWHVLIRWPCMAPVLNILWCLTINMVFLNPSYWFETNSKLWQQKPPDTSWYNCNLAKPSWNLSVEDVFLWFIEMSCPCSFICHPCTKKTGCH